MTQEEIEQAKKRVEERAPLLFAWLAAHNATPLEALDLLSSVYLTIARNTLGNARTLEMLRAMVIFAERFQGTDPAAEPITGEITITTPPPPSTN